MRITLTQWTPKLPAAQTRLRDWLRDFGHDVSLVDDSDFVPSGEDLVWFTGTFNWFPHATRTLRATPRPERPRTLLWQTEPLPLPRAAGIRLERLSARELAKIVLRDPRRSDPRSNARGIERLLRDGLPDVLVVSTRERQQFLAERGIESIFAPLGYGEYTGKDLGLERDIDVLFLGELRIPRRQRIFRRLRASGVNLVTAGDWNDPNLFGAGRVELVNRSKILLNIPRHPGLLSGGRMLIGMANKALMIAEPIYAPDPYRPGIHYVSAELDEFPEAIARYLADEEARRKIVEAAYEFVTTELTMRASVESILRACFSE